MIEQGAAMTDKDRSWMIAVAALAAAVFLPTALLCGLYLDDWGFLLDLSGASPASLWTQFVRYVPGRNLYVPFFYLLIRGTGGSVAAMHVVTVVFDAVAAALVFLLARRLTGLRSLAAASALAFVLAPNHGETHFWITLIPQCQIPTFLVLAAFLLASSPAGPRLSAACAVYAVALFTYDQVFFLWPLLLWVAWRGDATRHARRYAPAAAGLLGLNVVHLLLRYLAPYASGGRPLIRVNDVILRGWDVVKAVGKGVLPLPTHSPAQPWWTVLCGVLAVAAGALAVREVRREWDAEAAAARRWLEDGRWLEAALFGSAWTVLAYAPNLFWYLSPRHSLLPSVGWALTLASAGAWAVRRWGRLTSVLPVLAVTFFAAAVVSNVSEGAQWADSRSLHDRYLDVVRRLSPDAEAVFLVGAPRYERRAPMFNLSHDVVLSARLARVSGNPANGDYLVVPTRAGLVSGVDVSTVGDGAFHWMAASRSSVIVYDAAGRSFSCVAGLDLREPGGSSRRLDMRPDSACAGRASLDVNAVLAAREVLRDAAPAGGPSLRRAEARPTADGTHLTFEWTVAEGVRGPLAFVPRMRDAAGALVWDTVFEARSGERRYPVLWPLVDDEPLVAAPERGVVVRETFVVRKPLPAARPLRLEVTAYEVSGDAAPRPVGHSETVVAVGR